MDIKECICALREELLLHADLYNAFYDSILSVLKPKERYFDEDGSYKIDTGRSVHGAEELAKEILDRIIGEEWECK